MRSSDQETTKKKLLLSFPAYWQLVLTIDIITFKGDESNSNSLTVFVDCKDALGAVTRQTATITVMPKVIDTAFLASAQDDILKSFESADWNSAIGKNLLTEHDSVNAKRLS